MCFERFCKSPAPLIPFFRFVFFAILHGKMHPNGYSI